MSSSVAHDDLGIPAEELERVFDRFARVDPNRTRKVEGVGLGLPIAKTIAEAHRGSIRVRSSVGGGSVFELSLPASTARPELAPARQAVDEAEAPKSVTGS